MNLKTINFTVFILSPLFIFFYEAIRFGNIVNISDLKSIRVQLQFDISTLTNHRPCHLGKNCSRYKSTSYLHFYREQFFPR